MDSATARRLIEINRDFYDQFGEAFSETRQRLQPGVRRIIDGLGGDEAILDLGCGNGELARALAGRGHAGEYLGVDFSLPLLRDAASLPEGFPARFLAADLARLPAFREQLSIPGGWTVVTAFAVLHHIPSGDLRLNLLRIIGELLATGGRFIHSNWHFLNSGRIRARIQPWDGVGVAASEVDEGDYLLDWRRGGRGLRYVHHFAPSELQDLAAQSGFRVTETFHSDGDGGRLGLYQIWEVDRH